MKKWILALAVVGLLTGCGSRNMIEEGTEELAAGNYGAAIAIFEEALQEEDQEEQVIAAAWRGIGMARFSQQDYAGTIEALQAALTAGGEETPIIYNMLGASAMQLQSYEEAIAFFDRGLAVAGQSGEATDNERADSEDADNEEAAGGIVLQEMRRNIIVCYQRLLNWEAARQRMTEYLQLYPDDAEARREAEFLETR